MTTAIIGTGGIGSAIARELGSGGLRLGGIEQSGRLEVRGDLHDRIVDAAEARSLV